MTETIEIKPGQIRGKTEDALRSVLERSGEVIVRDVHIPRTFERKEGVCWTAIVIIGVDIATVYCREFASKVVRLGMKLTRHADGNWWAEPNSYVPRPKATKTELGTIFEWPPEPILDRLGKCVEMLNGFGYLTDPAAARIRKQIKSMKERGHE